MPADLTDAETAEILAFARSAIGALPASRKAEKFEWSGRSYCAVRVSGGVQVQSSDRRRLIAECRLPPG